MPDPVSAIIGSAVIGAGSSLFGASQQADAQKKATKAQEKATEKQLALQKEIFETNKETAKPWIEAGETALDGIMTGIADGSFDLSGYGYDDLIKDPGFQFRLDAGLKAREGSAAARGKLLSGDQQLGIDAYAQDMASQEFGNAYARTAAERDARYGRLRDVSQQGLAAGGNMAGVSQNFADSSSRIIQQGATQAGNAAIQTGNAWAGAGAGIATAANQGISNYMLFDRLNNPLNVGSIY